MDDIIMYIKCRVVRTLQVKAFDIRQASVVMVASWGHEGSIGSAGQLTRPTALAVVGNHLYVMEATRFSTRVLVFGKD
jgi:hypothetical protein